MILRLSLFATTNVDDFRRIFHPHHETIHVQTIRRTEA
jgi:hypothetical protein